MVAVVLDRNKKLVDQILRYLEIRYFQFELTRMGVGKLQWVVLQ